MSLSSTPTRNVLNKKPSFFSKTENGDTASLFKPRHALQTKLTIGKPGDKYEQEADTMADRVVNGTSKKENQTFGNASSAAIQTKCADCLSAGEADEKEQIQKQEEESGIAEKEDGVQRKPIFESADKNTQPIQAKPVEAAKSEAKPQIQPASIAPPVQTRVADPDQDTSLQRKEEQAEDDTAIQKKPIFESAADAPPEDIQRQEEEPDVQTKPIFESNAEPEQEQVQRKEDTATERNTSDLESSLNASKGGGSPMPEDTRTDMESEFGSDFSGVRVHTGPDAANMSNELGAQAFTHGNDIYFNEGKYDTGSSAGKHLLAHELTHTVQQGGFACYAISTAKARIRKRKTGRPK